MFIKLKKHGYGLVFEKKDDYQDILKMFFFVICLVSESLAIYKNNQTYFLNAKFNLINFLFHFFSCVTEKVNYIFKIRKKWLKLFFSAS